MKSNIRLVLGREPFGRPASTTRRQPRGLRRWQFYGSLEAKGKLPAQVPGGKKHPGEPQPRMMTTSCWETWTWQALEEKCEERRPSHRTRYRAGRHNRERFGATARFR